jgi:protein-S-isoprenylcysteine O-methyltransferase Ste14
MPMTAGIAKALYFVCTIIWYVIRYPYERRARRTPVRRTARGLRDRLLVAAAVVGFGGIPVIYVATRWLRAADREFIPALGWLGLVVFVVGIWLNYRTHRDLGRNFSPSLDVRPEHTLVTTGVYAWVRHPMYAAFFLWAVAQALLLPNWVAGFSGLVGFAILYFLRVGQEERLMLETFGEAYRAYMSRTARLVPWVY